MINKLDILGYNQRNQITVTDDTHHFVVYSGGCDSTLLLYEVLKLYGHTGNVHVVSMDYEWLDSNKKASESEMRDKFLNKMKERGYQFSYDVFTVSRTTCSWKIHGQQGGIPQCPGWISLIPVYMAPGDIIYLGYIRGDDYWMYESAVKQVIQGFSGVLDRNIQLSTPMDSMWKGSVLLNLKSYDIYDDTWYCELPHEPNQPCGKCHPCSTHAAAMYQNIFEMDFDEEAHAWAQGVLDSLNEAKQKSKARYARPLEEIIKLPDDEYEEPLYSKFE